MVTGSVQADDATSYTVISQGLFGTVQVQADGSYSYSLDSNRDEPYLNDGAEIQDTFILQINTGSGSRQEHIHVSIVYNNTQDSTTLLTVNADKPVFMGSVQGQDAEGQVYYEILGGSTAPKYGTIDIDENGIYTYTVDTTHPEVAELTSQYYGVDDYFTILVRDENGTAVKKTFQVFVTGADDAPTISPIDPIVVSKDTTIPISTTFAATDDIQLSHFTVPHQGEYGTVTITQNEDDETKHSLSYTLDVSHPDVLALLGKDPLQDTVTIRAYDNDWNSVEYTVQIHIYAQLEAPVVTEYNESLTLVEDNVSVAQGNIQANDPQFTKVSYTIKEGSLLNYGSVSIDAYGQYTYILDNTNYNVNALTTDSLTESFTVVVTSTTGLSTEKEVTVTIEGHNDIPTISSVQHIELTIDRYNHSGYGSISVYDDNDNHTLSTENTIGTYGTLSLDNNGFISYDVDITNSTILGLGSEDTIQDSFVVTITDDIGQQVEQTVYVTITGYDDAPIVTQFDNLSTQHDNTAFTSGQIRAVDMEGTALSYSIKGYDASTTYGTVEVDEYGSYYYMLDTSIPAIANLASGKTLEDNFIIVVTDATEQSVEQSITVTINGANADPVVTARDNLTAIEDSSESPSGALTVTDDTDSTFTYALKTINNAHATYGAVQLDEQGGYTYFLNNQDERIQNLGKGDSLQDRFTIIVYDSQGGSVEQSIAVTIQGSNDAPTVTSVTDLDMYVTSTQSPQGSIQVEDVDDNTSFSYTIVDNVGETYGSASINSQGTYTYTLNKDHAEVKALAEGQVLHDSFTILVSDGDGGSVEQVISVVINPANVAPRVNSVQDLTLTEDTKLTATGQIAVHDEKPTLLSYAIKGGNTQLNYGSIDLSPTGEYTYTLDNTLDQVNKLSTGETLTESFTLVITDNLGESVEQEVAVTIYGNNDLPQLVLDETTLSITEGEVSVTGGFTANDIESGSSTDKKHSLIFTSSTASYGTIGIAEDGTFTYTLNNADPAIVALSENQSLEDSFTLRVRDAASGTHDVIVTIIITGINTAPTIENATTSLAVTEDTATGHIVAKDVNGTIESIAVDDTAQPSYGSVTILADGSYTYTLNNADPTVVALNENESLKDSFILRVHDAHAGTYGLTITVTITSSNTTPIITSATQSLAFLAVTEDTASTATGHIVAEDVDGTIASIAVDATAQPSYGSVTILADGSYTYTLDNDNETVNKLGAHDSLHDSFTIVVTDDGGATVTQVIQVAITGTNDAPVVESFEELSVQEDSHMLAQGTLTVSDADSSATPSYSIKKTHTTQYGSISIDEYGHYTYTLNDAHAAVNTLAAGENLNDSFTVIITDHAGASVEQRIEVSITGSNDVQSVHTEQLTLRKDTKLTDTGIVHVVDADNTHFTYSISGTSPAKYGRVSIDADGTYTYVLDNSHAEIQDLEVYNNITDTFTVITTDNNNIAVEKEVTVTIHGNHSTPQIGDFSNLIVEKDKILVSTGELRLEDYGNRTIEYFIMPTGETSFGTVYIDGSDYTYRLHNDDPAIKNLYAGETLTDTFTIAISNEAGMFETQQIVVTILGSGVPTPTNTATTRTVNDILPATVNNKENLPTHLTRNNAAYAPTFNPMSMASATTRTVQHDIIDDITANLLNKDSSDLKSTLLSEPSTEATTDNSNNTEKDPS